VILRIDSEGTLFRSKTSGFHVAPFDGANIEPEALKVNGIDPYHPFRLAKPECDVLQQIFKEIRAEMKDQECTRAVLVGHNASFDLGFLNAAVERCGLKRNPFHPFSNFDTVSLAGLAFGQTVLARAAEAAGLSWNTNEAHSAIYDAERTADLFCIIVNRWKELGGWQPTGN